jgi:putative hydrolase of the HAD superfamily
MSHQQTVVLVDADNTLWDTDAVFRDAQLLLLARTENECGKACTTSDRLAFVRSYDQALAQKHHLHLRYPPQLLVRCIEAGLAGLHPEHAARDAVAGRLGEGRLLAPTTLEAIVSDYTSALSRAPQLLPGVLEGVRVAKDAALRLYVMTEGRVEKQKQLLELHGLHASFEGVWELTKERAQFDRVVARFAGRRVVVIGDQPDRDILPAKAAGCTTILIPSRFKPSWHTADEYEAADHVAKEFLEAVRWCIKATAE